MAEQYEIPESPIKEKGYFGNLTPEQEEALQIVRKNLQDVIYDRYDDARLLRFLRARAFDVKAAETMLRNDITWRKENDVDNILETFPKTPLGKQLVEWYPTFIHKTDKYGLPVTLDRITSIDPKSLLTSVPVASLVKMRVYFMERTERAVDEAAKKAGRPIDYGIIAITDVSELGWKHMYTPGVNAMKQVLTCDKEHYPELLRKLVIVGCPRIFGMFWTLFKPILDPRTVEKTELHTGNDFHVVLKNNMKISNIPHAYGGKCDDPDHQPNCWAPGVKYWKSDKRSSVNENSYIDVHIKARSHHEVPVQIQHPHTTIALEFKVEHHDVKFKILRQKTEKEVEEVVKLIEVDHNEPYQTSVVVEEAGSYILYWDNSSSYMRSKQISYQLELILPEETVAQPNSNENVHD